jgi:hypothetical protein
MTTNGKDQSDPPNLDTIIKLMGMTGSMHDPEALTALRMATAQLKKWGWTWESILRGKIKIMPDPFASIPMPAAQTGGSMHHAPAPPPPPKQFDNRDEIEKFLEKVMLKKLPRDINLRLASIERTWNANGFLLWKDYDFLRQQANSRRKY